MTTASASAALLSLRVVRVGTSYALFRDLQVNARSFTELGAHADQQFVLSESGAPVRVRGVAVSAGLLELLGFSPMMGRLVQADRKSVV